MGFFGGYIFDGSSWRDFDPQAGQIPPVTTMWLSVYIYDSDIAEVRYEPAGPGSGTAFLGFTPRAYYEDESASAPADVAREAAGLALWVARQQGRADEAELRQVIAPFIADDTPESLDDLDADDDDDDDADLDEADIFVEAKVSRFLKAVGLPVPPGLPRA
jgi:hypothetical protein